MHRFRLEDCVRIKQAGRLVLFRFPHTDLEEGKLRPALLLGRFPCEYDDWLICMISSQTQHYISGFEEIVKEEDADFSGSGLKVSSVIRIGRLAVVGSEILLGAIGQVAPERLQRIKSRLAEWLVRS